MRDLTEQELTVLGRLYKRVLDYQDRNEVRTNFAEAEARLEKLSVSIPPEIKGLQVPLGWPQKACDKLAERLTREGFTVREESELSQALDDVFSSDRVRLIEAQALDASLRHGPAFVFTSRGNTAAGEPEVLTTARSALSATCEVDPRSGVTRAALEVIDDRTVNLWLPGVVLTCDRSDTAYGWRLRTEWRTGTPRVRCTPYVHDPTLEKPFGRSRITPSLMGFTMAATRTMLRQESAEDFHAAPRMAVLGATKRLFEDKNGNPVNMWDALTGAVWGIPDVKDPQDPLAEPRRVELKQFQQMTQMPYTDKLRQLTEFVAGETSIPASELGMTHDANPASAEAVQAHEGALVRVARKQMVPYRVAAVSLARDVLDVLYDGEVEDRHLRGLTARFADPRTRSPLEQSQYVAQQVGTNNFQAGTLATLRELPISEETARLHAQENQKVRLSNRVSDRLAGAGNPEVEATQVLKGKLDALGVGRRAGATFESLLGVLGLDGIEDSGAVPTTLRMPEADAADLEEK